MFYQETKTAKAAAIGTIMPWGGGITSIPKGWIVCDGQFVDASSYPLLTQTVGDTYNTGTSSFAGSFPAYSGTIKMPDLNQKALMDVEDAYFTGGGSPTGRVADEDSDARTLLSTKIGTHESQSIVTSFTDVFTDIVFTLDPTTDATGYQGKITGNTKVDGEGYHTVYVAPRKLGRKHIKRHTHPGTYDTISSPSTTQPGLGVIPFGEVEYTIRMQAVDNQWGASRGDTYYWGWTDDSIGADGWSADASASVFTAPAISVGEKKNDPLTGAYSTGWFPSGTQTGPYTGGSYGSDTNLYQLWWPDSTMTDTPIGIDQGSTGVVLAKVESTPPPYELTPRFVTDTPITQRFIVSDQHPNGPRIDSSYNIKFAASGGSFKVPNGYRNYYIEDGVTTLPYLPGGTITPDTDSQLRGTLLSHPGYNFVTNDSNDKILSHTHDDFDVEFDSTRLKVPSSLTANVNIPTQTDFLGNADNEKALQIDFNVAQPEMTCLYIIRAY